MRHSNKLLEMAVVAFGLSFMMGCASPEIFVPAEARQMTRQQLAEFRWDGNTVNLDDPSSADGFLTEIDSTKTMGMQNGTAYLVPGKHVVKYWELYHSSSMTGSGNVTEGFRSSQTKVVELETTFETGRTYRWNRQSHRVEIVPK